MLRMTTLLLVATAFMASACAQTRSASTTDWSSITGTQVAKVSNIKSLIMPGFE